MRNRKVPLICSVGCGLRCWFRPERVSMRKMKRRWKAKLGRRAAGAGSPRLKYVRLRPCRRRP